MMARTFVAAARTALAERQQRIAREHELACARLVLRLEALMRG